MRVQKLILKTIIYINLKTEYKIIGKKKINQNFSERQFSGNNNSINPNVYISIFNLQWIYLKMLRTTRVNSESKKVCFYFF